MSHVVKHDFKVHSLDALDKVAERMGGKFLEGQTTYKWYGQWVNDYSAEDAAYRNGVDTKDYGKCLHAISFPNAKYEVGIVAAKDGNGYDIIYDAWDKRLKGIMGDKACHFAEAYNIENTIYQVEQEGCYTEVNVNDNGETVISVYGGNCYV
jgi:hypothetical protein